MFSCWTFLLPTDCVGLVVGLMVTFKVGQAAPHVLVLDLQLPGQTQPCLHGGGAVTGNLCPGAAENEYLIFLQDKMPGVLLAQRKKEVSILRGYLCRYMVTIERLLPHPVLSEGWTPATEKDHRYLYYKFLQSLRTCDNISS